MDTTVTSFPNLEVSERVSSVEPVPCTKVDLVLLLSPGMLSVVIWVRTFLFLFNKINDMAQLTGFVVFKNGRQNIVLDSFIGVQGFCCLPKCNAGMDLC